MRQDEDKNPDRPYQDTWNLLVRAVFQYTLLMGTVGQEIVREKQESWITRQNYRLN